MSSTDTNSEPQGRASLSSRRPSFSSIRSRIRKASLRSKRKSTGPDDLLDDPDPTKRWSTGSEHSLPPIPPEHSAAHAEPSGRKSTEMGNISPQLATSQLLDDVPPLPPASNTNNNARSSKGKSQAQYARDIFHEQVPLIMYFFAGTCLVTLLLTKVHWILSILVAACSAHVLWKKLETASRDAQWEHQIAAGDAEQSGGETVEWLNKTLATVWPIINSEYFAPFVDLLEDSLMTQVPGIVHSVRVEDMDQGSIPLRVKSFKVLPSDLDSFFKGAVPSSSDDSDHEGAGASEGLDENSLVDTGDYVNLEVTFAYRGSRPKSGKHKTKNATNNDSGDSSTPIGASATSAADAEQLDQLGDAPTEKIHMLIYMSIGLQKIAAVEVPVWVEMIGIEGKMRVRLQMTPVAPFIKHAAVTFVGAPKLEMSAKPLGRKMVIDAMNLPLISSYALHSVEDVIKGFIAPKSYTIDVANLLGAGDGPSDVYSIGLIVLVIHQASNLPAADTNGNSDPFVQVGYGRAGRTLYTSRVLTKTKDPIWQETAFLLVSPDELRDRERLRLTVFDADRFSSDDPLGKVEISIDRLIRKFESGSLKKSNDVFETRTDDLRPMRRGAKVQGNLKYSVGFFGLAHPDGAGLGPRRQNLLKAAASRAPESAKATDVSSSPPPVPEKDIEPTAENPLHQFMTPFDRFIHGLGLPMDDSVLDARRVRKERVSELVTMIEGAKLATAAPPDPSHPAGILAFHIHSIHNLEVKTTQRSYSNSKRLSQKMRYSDMGEDVLVEGTGAGKLPSSYVQVFLNDEAVFRTRTKTLNPRPYINGGSERYIGDWTTARIDFTVRDARMREGDPILGCVGLKLADVLTKTSKSTEWYTLTGGIGFGKIRITLLFRSIEIVVPRPLRGWNIGVLEVARCRAVGLASQMFDTKECHIMFETVGGRVETTNVESYEEYESGEGADATVGFEWPLKSPLRLPVRQRYPNFLYIHLRSESRVPGRHHKHAHAVVPMNRLDDDKLTLRRVPLFETSNWQRFEQDMLKAWTNTDQLLSPNPVEETGPQILPALEELCQQGSRDLPVDVLSEGHIKRVGWLEVDLILHSGIGPEHRSCVAGDSEMRFAYETYMALQDAGERARPKSVSSEKWRRSQISEADFGMVESSSQPSLKVDTSVADPAVKLGHRRMESLQGSMGVMDSDREVRASMDGTDGDGMSLRAVSETGSDLDDEDARSFMDSPEGRVARQRALHRQHQGAAQIKGFRTLSWLKTNAEDGVGRVKRQFDKQSKRIGKMESEGVSHF